MNEHVFQKSNINFDKLEKEFDSSDYSQKIHSMYGIDGEITIVVSEELTSGELLDVESKINNHSPVDMEAYVQGKILAAMDFGKDIMSQYGARNVLSGKTVAEVRTISDKLNNLQTLLLSGSLHVALDEIANTVPDALVTQADLDEFTLKIQDYLGL